MRTRIKLRLCVALVVFAATQLTGCGDKAPVASNANVDTVTKPSTSTPDPVSLLGEITKLKAEISRLQAENDDLRQTPAAMLLVVQKSAEAADIAKTAVALQALVARYPTSPEARDGGKVASALNTKIKAAAAEKERIARLGLKAIKVNPNAELAGVSIKVNGLELSKQWNFGNYDSGSRYREATRGSVYAVADVSITSKAVDPDLPGLGVYQVVGPNLVRLGTMQYEFQRWMDYGTYLGNDHDFRNDFSHTATIRFKAGLEISQDYRTDTLFLVASKQGCHSRSTERFRTPPVFYTESNCQQLKTILTVDDFSSGGVVALRVINASKL